MNELFDPLNLVLAAIALMVVWRLRSVLGQRTGTERPPIDPYAPPAAQMAAPRLKPAAAKFWIFLPVRTRVEKGRGRSGTKGSNLDWLCEGGIAACRRI